MGPPASFAGHGRQLPGRGALLQGTEVAIARTEGARHLFARTHHLARASQEGSFKEESQESGA